MTRLSNPLILLLVHGPLMLLAGQLLLESPDAGRLQVGAIADLVVIRPDIPWLEPPVDPLARLLFAWDDRWIEQTLLRGRTVCPWENTKLCQKSDSYQFSEPMMHSLVTLPFSPARPSFLRDVPPGG